MNRKSLFYLLLALVASGCGPGGLAGASTATPFIITSTLPPTAIPTVTLTPLPPSPTATTTPVSGQTKTQVNVRATPSAAGTQLAILPPFAPVQIVGVDTAGKWYQILYPDAPEGTGWVTAEYVYVSQGKDTIPVIGGAPTAESAPSGTPGTPGASGTGVVLQQINVRKGPGTQFDALGTLDPQDTVTLTGKSPDGTWLQIQYGGGTGWVAAAFIDASGVENLPIVGESGAVIGTGTATTTAVVLSPTPGSALADGDTAQEPGSEVAFSPAGTHALLYSSDVSAPEGDREDWVVFTPYGQEALLSLTCTGNGALVLELLQSGAAVPDWNGLGCGETRQAQLSAGKAYLLHVAVREQGTARVYVRYSLRIENTG